MNRFNETMCQLYLRQFSVRDKISALGDPGQATFMTIRIRRQPLTQFQAHRQRRFARTLMGVSLFVAPLLLGCSGRPPAIRPPDVDPHGLAAAAMEQYDANHDGMIDAKELAAAPSLRFSLERCDTDRNQKLTSDEIANFVQTHWLGQPSGIIRVKCIVNVNGRPLDGATISLEPEAFMEGAVKPASGLTRGGVANLDVANEDRPTPNAHGVQNGLYLVRISKQVDGKETIPDKFNERTTLGCEIASRAAYMPGPLVFNISTK
jgi:hypothetical protein